jgi:hypothetical protein
MRVWRGRVRDRPESLSWLLPARPCGRLILIRSVREAATELAYPRWTCSHRASALSRRASDLPLHAANGVWSSDSVADHESASTTLHRVAGFDRNGGPASVGIGGRLGSDYAFQPRPARLVSSFSVHVCWPR